MSKMAAFFAGLGSGYLKADRQRSEDERTAKKDAQDKQMFDANMANINDQQAARQEEKDFKAANIAAQSAGKQDTGYQVTDAAGSNAFTKDADAAAMLGDMADAKNAQAQTDNATRVSTGRTGATMQGTVAGNQVFANPAEAQAFAQTQNMTEYAKLKARQDVAEQYGKMDLSDDIKAKLTKLESEGVFKAFALAQTGDMEGAAKAYESTGNARMPKGGKFVATEVEDPATKTKRQVISVVGPDGAPLVPDLDKALRSYLTPGERYSMDRGDKQDVRQASQDKLGQENWTKTFEFNQKKEESDQKYKQRMLGIQASQEARAQATHKRAMEDDKLPPAVKMQAASLAKQMENIGSALNKSMAEGQFDPNNAGTVKLMESQAALGVKYSMLLKPYSSDKGVATSDPLGLGAQEPAAKSAESVKPAGPPARPQVTMAGVAATEPERTVAPSPPSSIERMQAESVKSFAPLAAKVKQADAAFAAVARSGDPVSIARYMQEAQALRAQLDGVVTAKFGNAAPKVMQQLFAQ